ADRLELVDDALLVQVREHLYGCASLHEALRARALDHEAPHVEPAPLALVQDALEDLRHPFGSALRRPVSARGLHLRNRLQAPVDLGNARLHSAAHEPEPVGLQTQPAHLVVGVRAVAAERVALEQLEVADVPLAPRALLVLERLRDRFDLLGQVVSAPLPPVSVFRISHRAPRSQLRGRRLAACGGAAPPPASSAPPRQQTTPAFPAGARRAWATGADSGTRARALARSRHGARPAFSRGRS